MAEQQMVKVTVPDGKGGTMSYHAPAESEMSIREVYSNLPPSEQIKIRIEPVDSDEERMRVQINEQNEIERLKAEVERLTKLSEKKPK